MRFAIAGGKVENLIKLVDLWKRLRPKHINKMSGILILTGITGELSPFWWPYLISIVNYFIELHSEHSEYIGTSNNVFLVFILLGVFLILFDRVVEYCSLKVKSKPLFDCDDSEVLIIGGTIKSSKQLAKLRNKSKFKMKAPEYNDGDQ